MSIYVVVDFSAKFFAFACIRGVSHMFWVLALGEGGGGGGEKTERVNLKSPLLAKRTGEEEGGTKCVGRRKADLEPPTARARLAGCCLVCGEKCFLYCNGQGPFINKSNGSSIPPKRNAMPKAPSMHDSKP